MELDWTRQLLDQLVFQWDGALRPRLGPLDGDDFRGEPVDGVRRVRRRADARPALAQGAGDVVVDYEWQPPAPVPTTTIAWRLAHIAMVFGERAANHFGEGGV